MGGSGALPNELSIQCPVGSTGPAELPAAIAGAAPIRRVSKPVRARARFWLFMFIPSPPCDLQCALQFRFGDRHPVELPRDEGIEGRQQDHGVDAVSLQ